MSVPYWAGSGASSAARSRASAAARSARAASVRLGRGFGGGGGAIDRVLPAAAEGRRPLACSAGRGPPPASLVAARIRRCSGRCTPFFSSSGGGAGAAGGEGQLDDRGRRCGGARGGPRPRRAVPTSRHAAQTGRWHLLQAARPEGDGKAHRESSRKRPAVRPAAQQAWLRRRDRHLCWRRGHRLDLRGWRRGGRCGRTATGGAAAAGRGDGRLARQMHLSARSRAPRARARRGRRVRVKYHCSRSVRRARSGPSSRTHSGPVQLSRWPPSSRVWPGEPVCAGGVG